jgi:tRNA pseudouridine38-40 synthase
MRYFLEIAYDGTPFHGWQRQVNGSSVQETIENCLSTLLRQPIEITGAGRTDTGVHALQTFAHFDYSEALSASFVFRMNRFLPTSIAIFGLYQAVRDDLHARFDAVSRAYLYRLAVKKNPFTVHQAVLVERLSEYDWSAIHQATEMLLSTNDFASFCKLHGNNVTTLCKIYHAGWEQVGDEFHFHIRADRFLRGMIRGIVGTLLDVGAGKRTPNDFFRILEARNRTTAGANAPAHGLYLSGVHYPAEQLIRIG